MATEDDIATNAQQPKSASADGQSAEQHSIGDQIAADRYKETKQATKKGPGVRYRKFRHGGTVW